MKNKIKCIFLGHSYGWFKNWDSESLGYCIHFGCARCKKVFLIVDDSSLGI